MYDERWGISRRELGDEHRPPRLGISGLAVTAMGTILDNPARMAALVEKRKRQQDRADAARVLGEIAALAANTHLDAPRETKS